MSSLTWRGCVGRLFPIAAGLGALTIPVKGQMLTGLRVEGPSRIVERTTARYTATAEFDTGKEFDVTLSSAWEVVPDTYAEFDFPGRLITREVPADQAVVVNASFTWDGITENDTLDVIILDSPPEDSGTDPWPEWQRTSARLGRTKTIGPRTPTISWRLKVDSFDPDSLYSSGPVLDDKGRIYVGPTYNFVAVDTVTQSIFWVYEFGDGLGAAASLFEDRVLFGSANDNFYCLDADTGEPIWIFKAEPHPNIGSVVDEDGVVYFASQIDKLYARRVSDGSEVWTYFNPYGFNSAGALDGMGRLFIGNIDRGEWLGLDASNGDVFWRIARGHTPGVSPVEEGRVYFTPPGSRHLYCVNSETGREIWNFNCEITVSGGPAVRKDGVIVVSASGGQGNLFAVSPDGEELWRYPLVDEAPNRPPMVDGANTTYFTTWYLNETGWVHAVKEDGSRLWLKPMPHNVAPTPILAPDGTLYVLCNDKYLYAFRDPAGDLNYDQRIDLADYAKFDNCMTDPRIWGTKANTSPGCELLDFDRDWDIDLADYAALQNAFGTAIP